MAGAREEGAAGRQSMFADKYVRRHESQKGGAADVKALRDAPRGARGEGPSFRARRQQGLRGAARARGGRARGLHGRARRGARRERARRARRRPHVPATAAARRRARGVRRYAGGARGGCLSHSRS